MPKTYAEQMQQIANEYLETHGEAPTAKEIAKWAIDNNLWEAQPEYLIARCAEDLADAMRQEHFTDAQGRSVRAKYAARVRRDDGKQMMLWDDGRTASEGHMRAAFQLRRQQIVGECHQLKTDIDSFNENRTPEKPVQMVFDFTTDLEEMELGDAAA